MSGRPPHRDGAKREVLIRGILGSSRLQAPPPGQGFRGSGRGYGGFLPTIVDTLDASVARNRGKRAQVVAF